MAPTAAHPPSGDRPAARDCVLPTEPTLRTCDPYQVADIGSWRLGRVLSDVVATARLKQSVRSSQYLAFKAGVQRSSYPAAKGRLHNGLDGASECNDGCIDSEDQRESEVEQRAERGHGAHQERSHVHRTLPLVELALYLEHDPLLAFAFSSESELANGLAKGLAL